MNVARSLKPHDVSVLLARALNPGATYRDLAAAVGMSVGEAHNATKRLLSARLLRKESGAINVRGALEFLTYGVPYVFPGELGPETRGVPTAYSAPPLSEEVHGARPVVWPSADGLVRGDSLAPLCAHAPQTMEAHPALYRLLALVDTLRVGRARERDLARRYLEDALRSLGDPAA